MPMLYIEHLIYTIGNLPVTVKNIQFKAGSINLIYGKNNVGKTRFFEALSACSTVNKVYFNKKLLAQKEFVFFDSAYHSFFELTGNELLFEHGGSLEKDKIFEMAIHFNIPLLNRIETYSNSMKKVVQFLWVISFEK